MQVREPNIKRMQMVFTLQIDRWDLMNTHLTVLFPLNQPDLLQVPATAVHLRIKMTGFGILVQ